MRVIVTAIAVLGLLASLFAPSHADAHTRSQSFSHWSIEGQAVDFSFAVDARRATQLAQLYDPGTDLAKILQLHVGETVLVLQGSKICTQAITRTSGAGSSVIRVSGRFTCPELIAKNKLKVSITAFQAVSPTHIHIARVEYNGFTSEYVLREGRASFAPQADRASNDFWGFVTTGFLHVLSGFDHLVFLLAMVLVAQTTRIAILCITGFTLGHSLSLAVATLGWVAPNEQLIEAMIGLTIAVTALESGVHQGINRRNAMLTFSAFIIFVALAPLATNSLVIYLGVALAVYVFATGYFSESQAKTLLPLITTVFGLVHGAGFAGGLKEAVLLKSEIIMPLFGFNAGVELAQLFALSAIIALLWMVRRVFTHDLNAFRHYASVIIFGLGCFWFAARLWS